MKNYYEILRELREDADLKQQDIAELLGTTKQYYGQYELGKQLIPTHHLITLADYYHTSTDYILGRTNIKKPYPKP